MVYIYRMRTMENTRYFSLRCTISDIVLRSNYNYWYFNLFKILPSIWGAFIHCSHLFSIYRFDMLKSANGEINGSLKVIQNAKKKSSNDDWTWKEQLEMVKFTNVPISESLLKLDPELDALAIECFECIMRYMGDLPTTPEFTEVKCVYTILMVT